MSATTSTVTTQVHTDATPISQSYQSFDIYIASYHYSHHSHSCSTNDLVEECVDMNREGKRRSQTREEGEMRGEITDVNIYRIAKT
jgi:hypothetical protein